MTNPTIEQGIENLVDMWFTWLDLTEKRKDNTLTIPVKRKMAEDSEALIKKRYDTIAAIDSCFGDLECK
jgi:hypothetical protein